ncbi:hypothetical protein [Dethiothermospora halolimnae]|uniref:hypothetical protein n=1 Tax=Dethiothermospora halolimnae TaxID=3114390 RepID=UPI003CCBC74D
MRINITINLNKESLKYISSKALEKEITVNEYIKEMIEGKVEEMKYKEDNAKTIKEIADFLNNL